MKYLKHKFTTFFSLFKLNMQLTKVISRCIARKVVDIEAFEVKRTKLKATTPRAVEGLTLPLDPYNTYLPNTAKLQPFCYCFVLLCIIRVLHL